MRSVNPYSAVLLDPPQSTSADLFQSSSTEHTQIQHKLDGDWTFGFCAHFPFLCGKSTCGKRHRTGEIRREIFREEEEDD